HFRRRCLLDRPLSRTMTGSEITVLSLAALRFRYVRSVEVERVGGLHRGVELGGVAPLLARPVARAFAAPERHVIVDAGGRQIDHHHAGLGIALEVAGVFETGGADAG